MNVSVTRGTSPRMLTMPDPNRARSIAGPLRLVLYCNEANTGLSFRSISVKWRLAKGMMTDVLDSCLGR